MVVNGVIARRAGCRREGEGRCVLHLLLCVASSSIKLVVVYTVMKFLKRPFIPKSRRHCVYKCLRAVFKRCPTHQRCMLPSVLLPRVSGADNRVGLTMA